MERIVIVEDVESLRSVLSTVLEREGYQVVACETGETALLRLETEAADLVISDFKLPGMNGIELLRELRRRKLHTPFLLMTAFGSIDIAVEAMREGAQDFIQKPFETEFLLGAVRDLIAHRRIVDRRGGTTRDSQRMFLTSEPSLQTLLRQAEKVAAVDSSVLILGESGTGKELLARYIHDHSGRADKPFVAINCAALPAELLESEFFGHEAGSFTGATQTRIGLFEYASEGTIFLDEIGDMPKGLQVKLLRALQEREIKRVGSNRMIKVAPRVIAATNLSREEIVDGRRVREDLYYRLAVVAFEIPPLSKRPRDVTLLVDHFMKAFSASLGRRVPRVDETALDMLRAYRWPGNARELENVIERAMLLCDDVILPEHLGISLRLDLDAIIDSAITLHDIAAQAARKAEIEMIYKVLARVDGNKSKAAQMLGVSYKTLLNKVKEYSLNA